MKLEMLDRLIDQSTNNDGVDEVQAHSISSINNIQPEIVKNQMQNKQLIRQS